MPRRCLIPGCDARAYRLGHCRPCYIEVFRPKSEAGGKFDARALAQPGDDPDFDVKEAPSYEESQRLWRESEEARRKRC